MYLPEYFRELKNREMPPALIRAIIKLHENICNPINRFKISKNIKDVRKVGELNDLDTMIGIAFNGFQKSIAPLQRKSEIKALLKQIQERQPLRILEIGTLTGGTLFLFTRVVNPNATIISIDLPYKGKGIGYPKWKIPFLKAFELKNQTLHLIRGNSHDKRTLNKVVDILQGEELDFIFIDGDHSYDGAKKDFEMYSPHLKKGGIVAFHDIEPINKESKVGVYRLWTELKQLGKQLEFYEFIEKKNEGLGIGILMKNGSSQS